MLTLIEGNGAPEPADRAPGRPLRIATAGSVDDGKSTLIGRLLYDSKQVLSDQLEHVEQTSRRRGDLDVDLALLTDGLRAEREQGITIDVAYRYFATPRRRFIIADTPGHEQYTRNMVTGASTADLALVLVDARKGVIEQSKRHAFVASLLGVPHLVVCVNKMDLVDYSETRLRRDRRGVRGLRRQARADRRDVHPDLRAARRQRRGALAADALVRGAAAALPPRARAHRLRPQPDRLPLPRAVGDPPAATRTRLPRLRGPGGRRGAAAGRRRGGAARRATAPASPSIDTLDGPLEEAFPPMSVSLRLEDDLDVSRGDMICRPNNRPTRARCSRRWSAGCRATRCPPATGCCSSTPRARRRATVEDVRYRIDVTRCTATTTATTLELNDIGRAEAAHERPAGVRRLPPQPPHRQLHPDRRGDQRHRRRGHDRGGAHGRVGRRAITEPARSSPNVTWHEGALEPRASAGERSASAAPRSGSPACPPRASRRSPRRSRSG